MKKLQITPEFAAALVAMQGQVEGAVKGKQNPHLKNKYADLASCWDACEDALQKNGIAILQPLTDAPAGFIGINQLIVYGPTGEVLSEHFTVPVKDATNAQAYGSSVTYGRRYSLCSAVGIRNADDDGNAGSGTAGGANRQAAKSSPEVSAGATLQGFEVLTDVEAMKTYYHKAKTANIPEPSKTEVLTKMANAIKAKVNK